MRGWTSRCAVLLRLRGIEPPSGDVARPASTLTSRFPARAADAEDAALVGGERDGLRGNCQTHVTYSNTSEEPRGSLRLT